MKCRHHAPQISRSKRQPRTQVPQSCYMPRFSGTTQHKERCMQKRQHTEPLPSNPCLTAYRIFRGFRHLTCTYLQSGTCTCLSQDRRYSVCQGRQWELKMPEINRQKFDVFLGIFLEYLKELIKLHIDFYLSPSYAIQV